MSRSVHEFYVLFGCKHKKSKRSKSQTITGIQAQTHAHTEVQWIYRWWVSPVNWHRSGQRTTNMATHIQTVMLKPHNSTFTLTTHEFTFTLLLQWHLLFTLFTNSLKTLIISYIAHNLDMQKIKKTTMQRNKQNYYKNKELSPSATLIGWHLLWTDVKVYMIGLIMSKMFSQIRHKQM